MKEKFDFIVLPPDAFHMTLRDTIVDARRYVPEVLEAVEAVKQPGDKVIVKYRTETQLKSFPTGADARVGYGKLLDFCSPETVVIGRPGSATWECLLNDIRFYSYWDMKRYQSNLFTSTDALTRLSDLLHIAQTADELQDNISRRKIYRPGKSKSDLIHQEGHALADIVSALLARRKHRHA